MKNRIGFFFLTCLNINFLWVIFNFIPKHLQIPPLQVIGFILSVVMFIGFSVWTFCSIFAADDTWFQ